MGVVFLRSDCFLTLTRTVPHIRDLQPRLWLNCEWVQIRRGRKGVNSNTHLYAFFMSSGDAPFSRPSTLYRLSPAVDSLRCGLFWSSMFQDFDNCDISETLPVSAKRKCGSRYKLRKRTAQYQHRQTFKLQ